MDINTTDATLYKSKSKSVSQNSESSTISEEYKSVDHKHTAGIIPHNPTIKQSRKTSVIGNRSSVKQHVDHGLDLQGNRHTKSASMSNEHKSLSGELLPGSKSIICGSQQPQVALTQPQGSNGPKAALISHQEHGSASSIHKHGSADSTSTSLHLLPTSQDVTRTSQKVRVFPVNTPHSHQHHFHSSAQSPEWPSSKNGLPKPSLSLHKRNVRHAIPALPISHEEAAEQINPGENSNVLSTDQIPFISPSDSTLGSLSTSSPNIKHNSDISQSPSVITSNIKGETEIVDSIERGHDNNDHSDYHGQEIVAHDGGVAYRQVQDYIPNSSHDRSGEEPWRMANNKNKRVRPGTGVDLKMVGSIRPRQTLLQTRINPVTNTPVTFTVTATRPPILLLPTQEFQDESPNTMDHTILNSSSDMASRVPATDTQRQSNPVIHSSVTHSSEHFTIKQEMNPPHVADSTLPPGQAKPTSQRPVTKVTSVISNISHTSKGEEGLAIAHKSTNSPAIGHTPLEEETEHSTNDSSRTISYNVNGEGHPHGSSQHVSPPNLNKSPSPTSTILTGGQVIDGTSSFSQEQMAKENSGNVVATGSLHNTTPIPSQHFHSSHTAQVPPTQSGGKSGTDIPAAEIPPTFLPTNVAHTPAGEAGLPMPHLPHNTDMEHRYKTEPSPTKASVTYGFIYTRLTPKALSTTSSTTLFPTRTSTTTKRTTKQPEKPSLKDMNSMTSHSLPTAPAYSIIGSNTPGLNSITPKIAKSSGNNASYFLPATTASHLITNTTLTASALSSGAEIGIAAGSIVAFWIILGPIVCLICRMKDKAKSRRAREREDEMGHRLVEEMIRMELARGREKLYRTNVEDEREIERLSGSSRPPGGTATPIHKPATEAPLTNLDYVNNDFLHNIVQNEYAKTTMEGNTCSKSNTNGCEKLATDGDNTEYIPLPNGIMTGGDQSKCNSTITSSTQDPVYANTQARDVDSKDALYANTPPNGLLRNTFIPPSSEPKKGSYMCSNNYPISNGALYLPKYFNTAEHHFNHKRPKHRVIPMRGSSDKVQHLHSPESEPVDGFMYSPRLLQRQFEKITPVYNREQKVHPKEAICNGFAHNMAYSDSKDRTPNMGHEHLKHLPKISISNAVPAANADKEDQEKNTAKTPPISKSMEIGIQLKNGEKYHITSSNPSIDSEKYMICHNSNSRPSSREVSKSMERKVNELKNQGTQTAGSEYRGSGDSWVNGVAAGPWLPNTTYAKLALESTRRPFIKDTVV